METPGGMLNLLETLPPRPPTPPRETVNQTETGTKHLTVCQPAGPRSNIQTPPGLYSPADSSGANNSGSSRSARKKVGFSAQAEYKDAPVYAERNARKLHPTPVSLPSSSSKPIKSILKVTCGPNPLDSTLSAPFDPANTNANLATMLDSTIQQLAGPDRESRLDAYMMLVQALKASNNLPDRVALQEKMSLFMQFMQRDIAVKASSNTLDSSLVSHALNLLITFFNFPAIASTLSNDFGVFIVDHCIRSFEDSSMPKDLVRRLMQVVALQNFSPKVMTSDRVARLVSSLHKIESHLKGKSIIMSRVLVYRKLVKQCKQLMVSHSDWLFDLFTDMLSALRDIRSAAISLGLEAAFSIGKEKALSRKVMEILNLTSEDKTYIEYYEERLQAMGKDKADSAAVPQIWSVIMLLLRCPFDRWDLFSRWLHIIQTCFNSSDFQTKKEANLAWSRLVYLLHLEDRSFSKMISTLSQPLAAQLKRKGSNKNTEELRKIVLGGVCNIFYYAFRPSTNLTLLDGYWDNCVMPLMKQLLDQKSDNASDGLNQASAILGGLFDCTTPRLWKEDHVTQDPLVKPEELPAVDSKWVRRNASKVFAIVEPILERDLSAVADSNAATHRLWRALIGTVASAASKEIKVSRETANFVAHAFNVLQSIWARGPTTGSETKSESSSQFLNGVLAYLKIMVEGLGLLPFTEKLLSMDKQNQFVPVMTPTHRPGKSQGTSKAPLHHLFSILSTLPPLVPDDAEFASFFSSAFVPFFATRSSKGQMDLAENLLSTLPMGARIPYGPWLLVAEKISMWLEDSHNSLQSSASASETPVGHDYRDVVRVLERGLKSTPNLPWEHWQSLFYSLCFRCREDAGDAGVAIIVIEPLAKVLVDLWSDTDSSVVVDPAVVSTYTTELLSMATQPRDRQAVDASRRRLWGTVISRSASFDVFDNLYKLINFTLECLYQAVPQAPEEGAISLLKEIAAFVDRSNPQLVLKSILMLQDGLSFWIRDDQAETRRQPLDVVEAVKSLWEKISSILASGEQTRHLQLDDLERLLCAAFESKHRHIVNTSLTLWNSVFQHEVQVEYPEKLKAVLLSLRPFVDIVLPGLEATTIQSGGREPFFVESQDELPCLSSISSAKSSHAMPPPNSSSRRSASPSVRFSVAAKRDMDATPIRKAANKRRTTPRLRHDDSQLQFAAIESSPAADQHMESQLLTERQKEVRERQKENAVLFPEIRSSPSKSKARGSSRRSSPQRSPQKEVGETPGPERTFEDFVTSTPTPRRGRLLPMADQDNDMTDPPSSPPEPRRNPLFAEIQSRSASSSLMDEWQFSSSPISSSPSHNRQAATPEFSKEGYRAMNESQDLDGEDDDFPMDQAESELPTSNLEDMVEDSIPLQPRAASPSLEASRTEEEPSTPQHSRPSQYHETAMSDHEKSVDEPSTSLPFTPRRSQRAAKASLPLQSGSQLPSNAQEDRASQTRLDEANKAKLVVELDSGRLDSSGYRQLSESPEKLATQEVILDCIVVKANPSTSSRRRSANKSVPRRLEAPMLPSQDEETAETSSQARSGSGKSKRARPAKSQGAGRKRKHLEPETEDTSEVVADSQQDPTTGATRVPKGRSAKRQRSSHRAVEQQVPEEEIPSSSLELSTQEGPTEVDVSMPDADGAGSEEDEVQSQIVQEAEAHSVREQTPEPDAEMTGAMQVEATEATGCGEQDQAAKEGGIFSRIMSSLQSGLNALRGARLSREEVYQVEDVFMDMKRELYEAERRGRT